MCAMTGRASVRAGGWSLIAGAALFVGVFSWLAAHFDYPRILDGNAEAVLPRLLATGPTGRAVWALYAFLPILWIPAGVGACVALRRSHPGSTLLALQCAVVAALSMMLGLMRWPTIHWRMAQTYAGADVSQRALIDTMFDGLNTYLGHYIGEFLGELAFSMFFVLTAWALLRSRVTSPWIAGLGLVTGAAGLVGTFRNVSGAVGFVSSINHWLLPLWMIVFGIVLLRWRGDEESA